MAEDIASRLTLDPQIEGESENMTPPKEHYLLTRETPISVTLYDPQGRLISGSGNLDYNRPYSSTAWKNWGKSRR